MYDWIRQKPAHFYLLKWLQITFFQMFLVLGMYNLSYDLCIWRNSDERSSFSCTAIGRVTQGRRHAKNVSVDKPMC